MESHSTRRRTPRIGGSSRSRRSATAASHTAAEDHTARQPRQSNRRRVAADALVDLTNNEEGSPPPPVAPKRRRVNDSTSASSSQTVAPLNTLALPTSTVPPESVASSLQSSFTAGGASPPGLPEQLEEINLAQDDDELGEDGKLLQKKQQELIASQKTNQEKPKLADFKCVICLDDPTDLASTRCGKLLRAQCRRSYTNV